jgi:hypothetical protein
MADFLALRAHYEKERYRIIAVDGPKSEADWRMCGMTPPDNDFKTLSHGSVMLAESYREAVRNGW